MKFYKAVLNKNAFTSSAVIGKYYQGGFENPMTRREAALILGVRESADSKKILEAHRRLMRLNHPD
jgi:hypothetical protein